MASTIAPPGEVRAVGGPWEGPRGSLGPGLRTEMISMGKSDPETIVFFHAKMVISW